MAQIIGTLQAAPQRDLMREGMQQALGGLDQFAKQRRLQDAQDLEQQRYDERMNLADEERLRQRALQRFQIEKSVIDSGRELTPELSQEIGTAVDDVDFGGLAGLMQAAPRTEEYRKKRAQQLEDRELSTGLKRAQISKIKAEPEIARLKLQSAQDKEIKKEKQTSRKDLTNRRVKLQKEYSGLDRVFGNMDALKKKFEQTGQISAADQFQLVRSFVPLSEINPGVVRDSEFDTARDLGGKLGGIGVMIQNLPKGAVLPENVIRDMFKSADTLKAVVDDGKVSRFGDINDEADFVGFDEKEKNIILGDIGRNAVQRAMQKRAQEQRLAQQQQFAQPAPVPVSTQQQAPVIDPRTLTRQQKIELLRQSGIR